MSNKNTKTITYKVESEYDEKTGSFIFKFDKINDKKSKCNKLLKKIMPCIF
tara:strand:- start:510 stop:662 length:153 start_codon:yes stop_codon:yes gene_type:complete